MILFCTCIHAYQDQKYGEQKRVCNATKGGEGAKCTVCGRIVSVKKKSIEKVEAKPTDKKDTKSLDKKEAKSSKK